LAGLIFAVYGVVNYLIFLATFLYLIAFVGNFPVPKTIDSGPAGALVPSLLVNVALLGLFGVQHSLMARPFFKKAWTRIVPKPIERSTYVLFANVVVILLMIEWRPLPQPIWTVAPGLVAMALVGLSLAGYGVALISTFLLSHFELFGLHQILLRLIGRDPAESDFRTPSLYKLVRHPLYLGFAIAFWATPTMTLGHLLFAVETTVYILIAIQLEERDLVEAFGDRYRDYRKRVGMLLPKV
jgi:methanethiol S-methyltransferase